MELQSQAIPATVEPAAVELPGGNQGTRQVEWPHRKNLGREQRRSSIALSTQQTVCLTALMERGCGGFVHSTLVLWPTGDSYRANAELSLEQEQRLRNNLI